MYMKKNLFASYVIYSCLLMIKESLNMDKFIILNFITLYISTAILLNYLIKL